MLQSNQKITALYCRLSQEDMRQGDSDSIINQRMILENYAKENGFDNTQVFVDDGYSGVNFERPAFRQILDLIEEGKVSALITKDLSRLGRNYIEVGSYTEIYFPRNNVRYIAINDNFDSLYAEGNELAPFKNLFNEWYARDTSKKIRAVKRAKAEKGERIGSRPPYGYLKDPNDAKKIIINEETAPIVRKIFSMCVSGLGPTMIANKLKEMKILTPVMYEYRKSGTAVTYLDPDRPYDWNAKTVADILSKEDYIGNTVNCRYTVPSYKDKRKIKRDASEQLRFEHTHEPIIDEQTWETVQKLRKGKRRPTSMGETSKFSGLLFCADCGSKLYFTRRRADDPKSYSFNCSHYRNNAKEKCTPHRIREVVLEEILLEEIRRITYAARSKEREFAEYINRKSSSENRKELAAKQRDYERLTKRVSELNALFKRLYEDNVLGRINNEQFRMLSDGYTEEQNSIISELPAMEQEIQGLKETASNVDKFISLARKYTRITELTPEILHTFVSKIVVHERTERYKQKSEQRIDIYFRYIGNVAEM